jgi:hypothetical protein
LPHRGKPSGLANATTGKVEVKRVYPLTPIFTNHNKKEKGTGVEQKKKKT